MFTRRTVAAFLVVSVLAILVAGVGVRLDFGAVEWLLAGSAAALLATLVDPEGFYGRSPRDRR